MWRCTRRHLPWFLFTSICCLFHWIHLWALKRFRGNFYFPGENSFISTLKKMRLELKSKVPELSLNQNYWKPSHTKTQSRMVPKPALLILWLKRPGRALDLGAPKPDSGGRRLGRSAGEGGHAAAQGRGLRCPFTTLLQDHFRGHGHQGFITGGKTTSGDSKASHTGLQDEPRSRRHRAAHWDMPGLRPATLTPSPAEQSESKVSS